MRKIGTVLLLSVFSAVLLVACMPESRSGKVYTQDQARTAQSVFYGTVLRVEEVTIEGTQSGGGTVAGGAMGGVLGSAVGSGKGAAISTVGGAIAGAVAGSAAEKKLTTKAGLEIEVEVDNGEIILVVQEKDDVYSVGDRVRIVKGRDGTTRIRQ